MTPALSLHRANGAAERVAGWLSSLLLLGTRGYVAWQFLKSGWGKLADWDTTLLLFHEEYHVPVLPPALAAVAGTTGELLFPTLLVLGLGTRLDHTPNQRATSVRNSASCARSGGGAVGSDGPMGSGTTPQADNQASASARNGTRECMRRFTGVEPSVRGRAS